MLHASKETSKLQPHHLYIQLSPVDKQSLWPLLQPRTWILGTVGQWTGSGAGGLDQPGCWWCGKRTESPHAGPHRRQAAGPWVSPAVFPDHCARRRSQSRTSTSSRTEHYSPNGFCHQNIYVPSPCKPRRWWSAWWDRKTNKRDLRGKSRRMLTIVMRNWKNLYSIPKNFKGCQWTDHVSPSLNFLVFT